MRLPSCRSSPRRNSLGPDLTEIGDRLGKDAIARTLVNPTSPMPSYASPSCQPEQFDQMVEFVSSLKEDITLERRQGATHDTEPGLVAPMRSPVAAPESGTPPETQVRAMFSTHRLYV